MSLEEMADLAATRRAGAKHASSDPNRGTAFVYTDLSSQTPPGLPEGLNVHHAVVEGHLKGKLVLHDPLKTKARRAPPAGVRTGWARKCLEGNCSMLVRRAGLSGSQQLAFVRGWREPTWGGGVMIRNESRVLKMEMLASAMDGALPWLHEAGRLNAPTAFVVRSARTTDFIRVMMPPTPSSSGGRHVLTPTSFGPNVDLNAINSVIVPRKAWDDAWVAVDGRRMGQYYSGNARDTLAAEEEAAAARGLSLYGLSTLRLGGLTAIDVPGVWQATSLTVESTYTGKTTAGVKFRLANHNHTGRSGWRKVDRRFDAPDVRRQLIEKLKQYLSLPPYHAQDGHQVILEEELYTLISTSVSSSSKARAPYADLVLAAAGNAADLMSAELRVVLVTTQRLEGTHIDLMTVAPWVQR